MSAMPKRKSGKELKKEIKREKKALEGVITPDKTQKLEEAKKENKKSKKTQPFKGLSPEDSAKIIKCWERGLNPFEIVQETGFTRPTVLRHVFVHCDKLYKEYKDKNVELEFDNKKLKAEIKALKTENKALNEKIKSSHNKLEKDSKEIKRLLRRSLRDSSKFEGIVNL